MDAGTSATPTVEALVLDLLEWLVRADRSYTDTMDAWRTTCPRLPVWEDANDRGFVYIEQGHGQSSVRVTLAGLEFLGSRLARGRARLRSPGT
jgi:hypothetical protein